MSQAKANATIKYIQKNSRPTRKVTAMGVSGAITLVLVWILNTYVLPPRPPITGEIATALTTIVGFVVSYVVPPSQSDGITSLAG